MSRSRTDTRATWRVYAGYYAYDDATVERSKQLRVPVRSVIIRSSRPVRARALRGNGQGVSRLIDADGVVHGVTNVANKAETFS